MKRFNPLLTCNLIQPPIRSSTTDATTRASPLPSQFLHDALNQRLLHMLRVRNGVFRQALRRFHPNGRIVEKSKTDFTFRADDLSFIHALFGVDRKTPGAGAHHARSKLKIDHHQVIRSIKPGLIARHPLHLMDVWRYHPVVEALAEQVRVQTLGPAQGLRLTRANWTSPRTDVDSVWNLAPHEVSIFREVFGVMPEPQAAPWARKAATVSDAGAAGSPAATTKAKGA